VKKQILVGSSLITGTMLVCASRLAA